MKALLLAAGLGTRLRPLTDTIPKCLAPIAGRPLLDYWLDLLFANNLIEGAVVNTSYLAKQVERHVAACRWADRVTLVHETTLLGTGGTVLSNGGLFDEGPVLVAHADNLTRFDLAGFLAAHASRPAGTAMTMMTFKTDQPSSCGIVELDGEGVVQAFHEKAPSPPGDRANAAVYIFDPEIRDFLAGFGRGVIDLSTEVLPAFLGRIATWHNADYHRDIGTPESLRQAERDFRQPADCVMVPSRGSP